jgi:NTE family protein
MTNAMTNALVLSAGGVAGAFQAGALSVILKKKEYAPDAIFGSSAGALNGAFLAHHAGGSSGPVNWASIGDELVGFWKQRITEPKVIWKARRRARILEEICTHDFHGLINADGFRHIVREQINPRNLIAAKKNGLEYRPGTVDLITGEILYPDASDQNIVDLIIASAAIPVAMDCLDIPLGSQTHPFVDGGTRDVAPLSRAIEKHYKNIICIVCQSQKLKELDVLKFKPRDLAQLMGRLMNIIINETVNNDLLTIHGFKDLLKKLKKRGLEREELEERLQAYFDLHCLTVIRPEEELSVDDMHFNSENISEMIDKGVEIATKVLAKIPVSGSYTICWEE